MEEETAKGMLEGLEKHSPLAIVVIFLLVGIWLVLGQIDVGKSQVAILTNIANLQAEIKEMAENRYTKEDAARDKELMNAILASQGHRIDKLESDVSVLQNQQAKR